MEMRFYVKFYNGIKIVYIYIVIQGKKQTAMFVNKLK